MSETCQHELKEFLINKTARSDTTVGSYNCRYEPNGRAEAAQRTILHAAVCAMRRSFQNSMRRSFQNSIDFGKATASPTGSKIYLAGPTPPKLFLAPAKGGGAPPDACGVGGAAAPSAASPSVLAGGRRIRRRQRWTERGPSTREMH